MPSSLATVLSLTSGFSPCPPVSVSVRAVIRLSLEAFLGSWHQLFRYLIARSLCITSLLYTADLPTVQLLCLLRLFQQSVSLAFSVTPSLLSGYWNIYQLSIDYACQPHLRSRLTQGGRTFPWKPWSIGEYDSHIFLATYTGILTSNRSSAPYGTPSVLIRTLPYPIQSIAIVSVLCLAPVNFPRRITRLVSCYALFKG